MIGRKGLQGIIAEIMGKPSKRISSEKLMIFFISLFLIIPALSSASSELPKPNKCTITDDFENGNIGKVIEHPSNTFTMEFGPGAGGLWFHIKLSGCKDKNLTFVIKMTRDLNSSTAHWYNDNRKNTPVVSHDQRKWEKIFNGNLDKNAKTFTFMYASRYDEEWIAYYYPYTNDQFEEFIGTYSNDPNIRVEIIGRTLMGRNQTMVTITDTGVEDTNKKVVWLIFREDAWETLGTYNAAGVIKFLLSSDDLAVKLRKEIVFKLIPIVSVDGVAEGTILGVGNDANPANIVYLTTTWTDNPSPKEIENIKQQIRKWKNSGKRIDLAGRYHSWAFQATNNEFGANNEIFKKSAGKYLNGVQIVNINGGSRFLDFLLTLYPDVTYFYTEETAVGTTIESSESFGMDTIKAIADYLEIAPPYTQMQTSSNFIHPNIFLNQNEINTIKAKVAANQEPWKISYEKMIMDADLALKIMPPSVTYGGKTPPSGDKHDYYTDTPYSSDGVFDPEADRTDYFSGITIGKSVRDLGLAYAFTGDAKYADKALDFIRIWTINSKTRMNPQYTDSQSNIEMSITIPGIFYGADLIWNYEGWDPIEKDEFQEWSTNMLSSAEKWSAGNNFENWRLVFIASGSVIAENSTYMDYAFSRWKAIIPNQMATDGHMVPEINRTNSLGYSLYTVNAMIQTAEIARHHGVDLYSYTLEDGRSLEKVLDYHAPFAANPSSWPYQQINAYSGENAALYELGYTFRQKSSYMDVINKWKRPMYESRIMGPVTLTHTFGAYPLTVTFPILSTPPNASLSTGNTMNWIFGIIMAVIVLIMLTFVILRTLK